MKPIAISRGEDVTYLSERLFALSMFRISLVGFIVMCRVAFPALFPGLDKCLPLVAAFLVFALVMETVRRRFTLTNIGLLVDALFIAVLISRTGGLSSRVALVGYVHVIAITLLLSYKTGLKISIWHSLLQLTFFYASRAGIATFIVGTFAHNSGSTSQIAFYRATTFWLIAASTALVSSVNERELRRRKNEFAALAEFEAELQKTLKPEAISSYVAASVVRLGFSRASVAMLIDNLNFLVVDSHGNECVIREWHDSSALIEMGSETSLSNGTPWHDDDVVQAALPFGTNVMVIPFGNEADARAWLIAEWPESRVAASIVRSIEHMCAVASLALRNADLLVDIEQMARTDALTGLANRQVFDDEFNRMIAHAERSGEDLSIVILDLDHFKQVNDNHGHLVGDEVLRRAAKGLKEASRDADIVVRYGGEEFAVLSPDCSADNALKVAERFRVAMSKYATAPMVTASCGVATFPTNANSRRSLLQAADDALYVSKENGRNMATQSAELVLDLGTAATAS